MTTEVPISSTVSDAELKLFLQGLEEEVVRDKNKNKFSLYSRMYDGEGNSLLIPLLYASKSELRSPKKRFIVTNRLEENSIVIIPSPTLSPKMSRMDAYHDEHFKEHNQHVAFVEEDHVYYINGSKTHVMSVTQFIEEVAMPSSFNADYVSNRILDSKEYKNGTSPYANRTAAEIRLIWQCLRHEAASHGTKVHRAIELALRRLDRNESFSGIDYLPDAFVAFMSHNPRMKPVAVETQVYDASWRLAGTFDILMEVDEPDYNPFAGGPAKPKKTILLDIKTSQRCVSPQDLFQCNVKDNANLEHDSPIAGRVFRRDKCHPSLQSFANSDYSHWLIQTNIYADLLEKNYNIHVDEIFILQIPDRNLTSVEYHLIPISRLPMTALYATRQEQVSKLFE